MLSIPVLVAVLALGGGRPQPAALEPSADQELRDLVGVVNASTIALAQRFIFSPTADFICFLPGRRLGNAPEAIASLLSFVEPSRTQSWA